MGDNANMATRYEREIPEGYEVRIEGNKVIFEQKESENEKIRKNLIELLLDTSAQDIISHHLELSKVLVYLEKQKEYQNNSNGCNLDELAREYIDGVKQYHSTPTWDLMQTAVCYGYHLREEVESEDVESVKSAEWSKEDKAMLNNIVRVVHMKSIMPLDEMDDRSRYKKYEDFLKSLPERFNLQLKQEWSKEDKEKIDDIIRIICDARECSKIAKIGEKEDNSAFYDELVLFLKSFCSPWKPSEEQISALEYFIRSWGESGTMSPQNPVLCTAKSLLTDLQKLLSL